MNASNVLSFILPITTENIIWPSEQFSVTLPADLSHEEEMADFNEGLEDLRNGHIVDLDIALTHPPGAQIQGIC